MIVTSRPSRAHRPAGRFLLVLLAPLAASAPLAAQDAGPVDPELLSGLEARSIGPAGMSGRVAAVVAAPSDPRIVYVGAATGGLWRSENGGLTYEPVFDDQPVAAIGAVAVHPTDPDVVWVGTGEANPRNSVSVGNGIYLSRDGGRSWTHLGLEGSERISRILLDPRDPDVAWVAALGPLWGEGPERGVFKTVDGGRTWTKVLYVGPGTGAADLAMDPDNPDKLFAAMWDHRRWPWFFRSGGPGSGLYVTRDGGESWTRLGSDDGLPSGELGRIGVAIAPSDPDIVYAYVEAKENGIYRSDDGGVHWTNTSSGDAIGNRPFYYADLRVDPELPGRVYSLWSIVSVSDDYGRTFRPLVTYSQVHPDHHAMWIDPADPHHILLGNDGGVAISHDRGATWRFVSNLPLAQYYHVRVDDDLPFNVYGGMQDNGSWKGPSRVLEWGGIRNAHWEEVGFGDGFDTSPYPDDPMRGYSMSQEGFLMRWDLRTGERKDIRPAAPFDSVRLRFNWNAGFAQDPFEPATIYYGSQYLHRSRDHGTTWEVMSPDLTTNNPDWQKQAESGGLTPDVTGAENFTTIVAIAPSPVDRGLIWVGTDDGRLQLTRDGGESWQSLEGRVKGVPANTWIPRIEASPHAAGTAFVVFDNHRRSDWTPYVFRTDDFGRSWKRIAAPDDVRGYALSLVQDPVAADLLWLGTEFGLWTSLDAGRHWFRWTHGLPVVGVRDLAIQARDAALVVGTHGRSAYVIDDYAPLRELSHGPPSGALTLFGPVTAVEWEMKQPAGSRFPGEGEFEGENPPYGAALTFWASGDDLPRPDAAERRSADAEEESPAEPGEAEETAEESGNADRDRTSKVVVSVADSAGTVVRRFQSDAVQGLNRIWWNLTRDDFRRPRRQPAADDDFASSGPQLPPGRYRMTLALGDAMDSVVVEVRPDPRAPRPPQAYAAKYAAILEAGALRERVADAITRVLGAEEDVGDALARIRARRADRKREGADSTALAALDSLESRGRALDTKLDSLEARFWTPRGTKGIVDSSTLPWSRIGYVLGALQSSWDAPTDAELAYLSQARAASEPVLSDEETLFATDVTAFRAALESAGIGLLRSSERPGAPASGAGTGPR